MQQLPEAVRAETLQQRNAHLLDTIANMTGLGAWELAVDSMMPLWSSHARQIFGLDPSRTLTLDDIVACYAAEARPLMATAFQEAVANGKGFDLTLPAIRSDGARLWVRCVGDPEVADDRTVRLSGAVQDVTQQYEADRPSAWRRSSCGKSAPALNAPSRAAATACLSTI